MTRVEPGTTSEVGGVSLLGVDGVRRTLVSLAGSVATVIKRATERGFNFPYLKDEGSVLAKRFGAICTPHAFLLDSHLAVVYSGRIDDSRAGNKITSRDLEHAVESAVSGGQMTPSHTEPFGCSIVW